MFSTPLLTERLCLHSLQADAGRQPKYGRSPRCIVLAPTRELAIQVEKEFQASGPGLNVVCVYGGTSISVQERMLRQGVDVVVGTPGRVIDLQERGSLNLSEVRPLSSLFVTLPST